MCVCACACVCVRVCVWSKLLITGVMTLKLYRVCSDEYQPAADWSTVNIFSWLGECYDITNLAGKCPFVNISHPFTNLCVCGQLTFFLTALVFKRHSSSCYSNHPRFPLPPASHAALMHIRNACCCFLVTVLQLQMLMLRLHCL